MALWGKTDTLAASPKYITRRAFFGTANVSTANSTITLTNSNTAFAVGDGVVYNNGGGTSITGLTSGTTYYIAAGGAAGVFKLSSTEAGAKAGTGLITLTGTGNAAQFLQRNAEGNESTAPTNGDHINNGRDLYFVDVNEAQQPENKARGLKGPGWWLYRTATNADGSVYHHAECLIALGGQSDKLQATTGDAADDAVVVDATVSITTAPTNASVTAPATATFSVVAALTGAGSLTYQWQVQEGGAGAWANVTRGSGGTTANYTTGATQVAASGTADSNGDKYRCVVGATTGNTDVTTTPVTLTVTA
jgi:hypothetical protein